MDLEESIKILKNISENKQIGLVEATDTFYKAIDTVLRNLKSYKRRYELAIEQNVKDYKNSIPKKRIENYKNKFIKESKKEKVFMTQSSQISASLISFCEELLED